jgi:cytochrome P450
MTLIAKPPKIRTLRNKGPRSVSRSGDVTVTLTSGAPLNILDPYLYAGDPLPAYQWLRDEAPVYWDPVNRIWGISRYDDVLSVVLAEAVRDKKLTESPCTHFCLGANLARLELTVPAPPLAARHVRPPRLRLHRPARRPALS